MLDFIGFKKEDSFFPKRETLHIHTHKSLHVNKTIHSMFLEYFGSKYKEATDTYTNEGRQKHLLKAIEYFLLNFQDIKTSIQFKYLVCTDK